LPSPPSARVYSKLEPYGYNSLWECLGVYFPNIIRRGLLVVGAFSREIALAHSVAALAHWTPRKPDTSEGCMWALSRIILSFTYVSKKTNNLLR